MTKQKIVAEKVWLVQWQTDSRKPTWQTEYSIVHKSCPLLFFRTKNDATYYVNCQPKDRPYRIVEATLKKCLVRP